MRFPVLVASLLALCYFDNVSSSSDTPRCKKTITVAVVDTGVGYIGEGSDIKLCKYGHKDFSEEQNYQDLPHIEARVPLDGHGHGTNIAGIIDTYAHEANKNYCLVIIKYYSDKASPSQNGVASIRAMEYLVSIKPDFVNYSGGGPGFQYSEGMAVHELIESGTTFVAAAGNEHENIDLSTNHYYPAQYDSRVVVVGSIDKSGKRAESSNWGKSVKRWEVGVNVKYGKITMSGTSQATAVATGKLVAERQDACK